MAVPFTYFGDLLGIGDAYNRGPEAAKRLLDKFYNAVFHHFETLCRHRQDLQVFLISDTLMINGSDCIHTIDPLAGLYCDLLKDGMLLRGGMARGDLAFQPRLELTNLQKRLPETDVLARAGGMEKALKGSRCAIEPRLAQELLVNQPEWLTQQGYLTSPYLNVPASDWRRSIAVVPDAPCHELIYLWQKLDDENWMQRTEELLTALKEDAPKPVKQQYTDTISLMSRSVRRKEHTMRRLGTQ